MKRAIPMFIAALALVSAAPLATAADAIAGRNEKPLKLVAPIYPRAALDRKIQGCVVASATVQPDGSVSDVTIVHADPPGVFDAEVVAGMRQTRYKPRHAPQSGIVAEFEFRAGSTAGSPSYDCPELPPLIQ